MTGRARQGGQALAVPAEPGSTVSAPSGFDPSRIAEIELRMTVTEAWRDIHYAALQIKGSGRDGALWQQLWGGLDALFAETFYGPAHYPTHREVIAIATEARRAETTGSACEGAGPKDIAQKDQPND